MIRRNCPMTWLRATAVAMVVLVSVVSTAASRNLLDRPHRGPRQLLEYTVTSTPSTPSVTANFSSNPSSSSGDGRRAQNPLGYKIVITITQVPDPPSTTGCPGNQTSEEQQQQQQGSSNTESSRSSEDAQQQHHDESGGHAEQSRPSQEQDQHRAEHGEASQATQNGQSSSAENADQSEASNEGDRHDHDAEQSQPSNGQHSQPSEENESDHHDGGGSSHAERSQASGETDQQHKESSNRADKSGPGQQPEEEGLRGKHHNDEGSASMSPASQQHATILDAITAQTCFTNIVQVDGEMLTGNEKSPLLELEKMKSITVFLPENSAWHSLDQEVFHCLENNEAFLTHVIRGHVAKGFHQCADLRDGLELESLNGASIEVTVSGGSTFVCGSCVTKPDLAKVDQDHAIVHAIAEFIIPYDWESYCKGKHAESASLSPSEGSPQGSRASEQLLFPDHDGLHGQAERSSAGKSGTESIEASSGEAGGEDRATGGSSSSSGSESSPNDDRSDGGDESASGSSSDGADSQSRDTPPQWTSSGSESSEPTASSEGSGLDQAAASDSAIPVPSPPENTNGPASPNVTESSGSSGSGSGANDGLRAMHDNSVDAGQYGNGASKSYIIYDGAAPSSRSIPSSSTVAYVLVLATFLAMWSSSRV